MFRKIVQPLFTTYAAITFFICFMIAFPFGALLSLGDNIAARKLVNKIYRLCFEIWLLIIGMPLQIIGKRPLGRYVYITNHASYIDDIIIFPAIRGHFRPLGKKEMTKIPIWGYQYKSVVVLVDRKNPESRAKSMELMSDVIKHEGSILIFPEGTFNETEKPLKEFYDGAFRLAITTQTPIAPIIFPDAVNRAHYSAWWKFWPGRNRAICLDPVPVAGLTIDDLPMLKQQLYSLMENALIKYRTPK